MRVVDTVVFMEDPLHPLHATCYQYEGQTSHLLQKGLLPQSSAQDARYISPISLSCRLLKITIGY